MRESEDQRISDFNSVQVAGVATNTNRIAELSLLFIFKVKTRLEGQTHSIGIWNIGISSLGSNQEANEYLWVALA